MSVIRMEVTYLFWLYHCRIIIAYGLLCERSLGHLYPATANASTRSLHLAWIASEVMKWDPIISENWPRAKKNQVYLGGIRWVENNFQGVFSVDSDTRVDTAHIFVCCNKCNRILWTFSPRQWMSTSTSTSTRDGYLSRCSALDLVASTMQPKQIPMRQTW